MPRGSLGPMRGLLVLFVTVALGGAVPDPPPLQRLVVATFDEQGVPAGMGDVVSDMLIRAIDAPGYQLLERRQVRRVLEEQAFASSDLTQPGEAVRYGRLADTRFVLVGTVYRLDGTYVVSARMVDSATGIVHESARAVVQFRTVDEMAARVAELARALGLRTGSGELPSQPDSALPSPGPVPQSPAPAPAIEAPRPPAVPSTVRDYLEQVGDGSAAGVELRLTEGSRTVRAGEAVPLLVRSGRDGFLSLFVVDAEGRVGMLLPNQRVGRFAVRSGQAVSVPGDLPFALRARAPFGPTRIKAIVTARALPLVGAGEVDDLLRRVTLGESVGTPSDDASAPAGWAGSEIEFLVVPAEGAVEPPGGPPHPPRPVRAEPPGRDPLRARDGASSVVAAFDRLGGADPASDRRAVELLRWPLRSPFSPPADIAWSPERAPSGDLPRIAVIDADFDPDDPVLARAFADMPPLQRDELRREIRRNGPAPFRHGNRVASLIGGEAPWLPSVLPGAAIVPIRITTAIDAPAYRARRGGAEELLDALRAVPASGCRVVNLSLAVPLEGDALRAFAADPVWGQLESAGVVLVCAAGNRGEDLDADPRYPACLDRPNVLCVGAVGPDGRLAAWGAGGSAYGRRAVDVVAPGTAIAVSDGGGRAGIADGTSYACAFATGAVARLIAAAPGMRPAEVVERLVARSRPLPEAAGACRGGLLQWPSPAD